MSPWLRAVLFVTAVFVEEGGKIRRGGMQGEKSDG